jgi:hypothetical protein
MPRSPRYSRSSLDTYARVGHIAAEFERLANVLLRRGCGNPALITYPRLDFVWRGFLRVRCEADALGESSQTRLVMNASRHGPQRMLDRSIAEYLVTRIGLAGYVFKKPN